MDHNKRLIKIKDHFKTTSLENAMENLVKAGLNPATSYYVHSTYPTILHLHGEVYIPRIKREWVILKTVLPKEDILIIDGVYKVTKCRNGRLVHNR